MWLFLECSIYRAFNSDCSSLIELSRNVRLSVAACTCSSYLYRPQNLFMQSCTYMKVISLFDIKYHSILHVHVIFTCNIEFRRTLFIIKWYFLLEIKKKKCSIVLDSNTKLQVRLHVIYLMYTYKFLDYWMCASEFFIPPFADNETRPNFDSVLNLKHFSKCAIFFKMCCHVLVYFNRENHSTKYDVIRSYHYAKGRLV